MDASPATLPPNQRGAIEGGSSTNSVEMAYYDQSLDQNGAPAVLQPSRANWIFAAARGVISGGSR